MAGFSLAADDGILTTPESPLRRLAVGLFLFALITGLLAYRNNQQQRAEHDWIALLNGGSILARFSTETGIQIIDRSDPARHFFGRHRVMVAIRDDEDAKHPLHIPECPRPIRIVTNRKISTGLRDQIADRYGWQNVD